MSQIDVNSMSAKELKQLLALINQDLRSIKKQNVAAQKAKVAKIKLENDDAKIANTIAQRFTTLGKVFQTPADLAPVVNKKIKLDIQIQQDILEFLSNGGEIKTARTRNKVKCQTFRNNKYSIANKGHQASITGKYGFFASPNKVSL
jgi:hypothetical protein